MRVIVAAKAATTSAGMDRGEILAKIANAIASRRL